MRDVREFESTDPVEQIVSTVVEGGGEVVVISRGAPCKCGPGFCASDAGVGFYGVCSGSEGRQAAADCPWCKAPHQSDLGCWACYRRGGNDPETAKLTVECLRLGSTFDQIFDAQEAYFDATGNYGYEFDFLPGGALASWRRGTT